MARARSYGSRGGDQASIKPRLCRGAGGGGALAGAAGVGAVADLVPVQAPLLAPGERAAAGGTGLLRADRLSSPGQRHAAQHAAAPQVDHHDAVWPAALQLHGQPVGGHRGRRRCGCRRARRASRCGRATGIPGGGADIRLTKVTTITAMPATISTPMITTDAFNQRTITASPCLTSPEPHPTIVAGPEAAGQRADRFLADAIGATVALARQVPDRRWRGLARRRAACATRPSRCAPARASVLQPPAPGAGHAAAAGDPVHRSCTRTRDLIVLDKPAGLVVHPAPGNEDGTLVNALLAHCGDTLPGIGGEKRPGIVHRLDKDTSGRDGGGQDRAGAGRAVGGVRRARPRPACTSRWSGAMPAPPRGTIEGAIGRDPRDRKRMAVVARGGKAALTHYRDGAELVPGGQPAAMQAGDRAHAPDPGASGAASGIRWWATRSICAGCRRRRRRRHRGARQALLDFPRQALHAARLGVHASAHRRAAAVRDAAAGRYAGAAGCLDVTATVHGCNHA